MTNSVYLRKCTLLCRSLFILKWIFANLNGTTKPPNFIIIYADDLGYAQTSVPMMKERPELPCHENWLERLLSIACLYTIEGEHSVWDEIRQCGNE